MKTKPSVAVLLSGREKFSPYYGGALARWSFEVYSRVADQFDSVVFGFPTAATALYPLAHQTSGAWRLSDFLARIPGARRYEEQAWLLALLGRLRQFDVLHVHNRPQWVGFLRRLGYRGSIVLHLQNNHLGHWTGPMLDSLAPHLDRLLVCSNFLRGTFAPRSPVLDAKTVVLFNGVNTELFFPLEAARQSKTIFFVGRFEREKGVLQLLNAFARVVEQYPDAQLVIGGTTGFGVHEETPYVREARSLAAALAKEKQATVQFTGYLHHDQDLPGWFQRAAIFTSPSLFQEPFGMVNAEAMACATPVVGSARGGIPEVLGDTGLLIDPENISQYAEALCRLLGDPEQRSSLGYASLQRCRSLFDWNVIARQWASDLADIASRQRIP